MMFSCPALRARCTRPVALALVAFALGGCSSLKGIGESASTLGGLLTPYRMDVQQGNVVVREQVQALQTGMSREQVRAILGTPLVASVFHANRWDYVFTFQRQNAEPQKRRVTVFFDGDALARIEADELPTEEAFVASLDVRRGGDQVPVLEATEAQLKAFDERFNRASSGGTLAQPPAASATSPLPTSYPPLETR